MSDPAGSISVLYGTADAQSDQGVRHLAQGDPVYQGETVVTGPDSALEIHFADGTVLSQSEGSTVTLDTYVFNPDTGTGDVLLKLTKGAFRAATGSIVDSNPEKFKVQSPLATIGIRGTHTGHLIPGDGQPESHGCLQFDGKPVVIQSNLGGPPQTLFGSGLNVQAGLSGLGGIQPYNPQQNHFFQSMSQEGLHSGPPDFAFQDQWSQGDDNGDDEGNGSGDDPMDDSGQGDEAGGNNPDNPGDNPGENTGEEGQGDPTGGDPAEGANLNLHGQSLFGGSALGAPPAFGLTPPETPDTPDDPGVAGAEGGDDQGDDQDDGQGDDDYTLLDGSDDQQGDNQDQGDTGSQPGDSQEQTASGSGTDTGHDDTHDDSSHDQPQEVRNDLHHDCWWAGDTVHAESYAGAPDGDHVLHGVGVNLSDGYISYSFNSPLSDDLNLGILNAYGSSFTDAMYGNDEVNTLWAGSGDDMLIGGDGNDHLYGDAGMDLLSGQGGDDVLHGGADNDMLYGGEEEGSSTGNDTLYGDAGEDMLFGQDGNDTLYGGEDNDKLYGGDSDTVVGGDTGTGDDVLHGDGGADQLWGQDGSDTLYGDDGADQLFGGADDDTLHGGADNDMLYGGDTVIGGDTGTGADVLFGDCGNDELYGYDGSDTLDGGADKDLLYGGADNDTLFGSAGGDSLYGGGGDDHFVFTSTGTDYTGLYIDDFCMNGTDKLVFYTGGDDGFQQTGAGIVEGTAAPTSGTEYYLDANSHELYYSADWSDASQTVFIADFCSDGCPSTGTGDIIWQAS